MTVENSQLEASRGEQTSLIDSFFGPAFAPIVRLSVISLCVMSASAAVYMVTKTYFPEEVRDVVRALRALAA